MPRSDEAQAFFHAAYSAIQEIPPGRVTSYGHIAKLIGTPQRPRQVGVCLKHLPGANAATNPSSNIHSPAQRFTSANVPWQRVISAKGAISPRNHPSGAVNQAAALRREGVVVQQDAMGMYSVDLVRYGWFPDVLPSEADRRDSHDSADQGDDINGP